MPSVVSSAKHVTYVSDIEGHWDYFCAWVELSPGLRFVVSGNHRQARTSEELELELEEPWHFVFGGDTSDKGPGTLRVLETLVRLKRKYPERVHLLLGNRDINKLRWTSELAQSEIDRVAEVPGAYWVPDKFRTTSQDFLRKLAAKEEGVDAEAVTPAMARRRNTKANKLRYMMEADMGAAGEFEFRRLELAHVQNVKVNEVQDADVVQSYEVSVAPGGWMYEFLGLAQLALLLGSVLFVHGQILDNSRPRGEGEEAPWSVGVVPGEEKHVDDVREWVEKLNSFARAEVDAWMRQPLWETPPKEATLESWSGRGGAELIAYGTPASPVPTVVYCRYLSKTAMPMKYPPKLSKHLERQGIRYVVVGHTPHGNAPTVIRSDGVIVVMADTSFSHMNSDVAYTGDNRGRATSGIAIVDDNLFVKGYTEEEQAVDYVVSYSEDHDSLVGQIQEPDPQGQQFFVKAKLPAAPGMPQETYLMTAVQGFRYEYAMLTAEQVEKALRGMPVTAAADNYAVTSHGPFTSGETNGHAFTSDGSERLISYLFDRLDRNGDGWVSRSELTAACTDKVLRRVFRANFPHLSVAQMWLQLDEDGDNLISMDEFRRKLCGEDMGR